MEITEALNEELIKKYKILFSEKEILEKIDKKANEVALKADIKGFRKGKVPASVIKMKYQDSLKSEVMEEAIQGTSKDVIEKNKFDLLSQPKVSDVKFENTLSFELEFMLCPKVPELDYKKISIEKKIAGVTDEELKKGLEHFCDSQRNFEKLSSKTAAKKNDAVLIDVTGSIDGKDFPEGKVDNKKLVLGSNEFIPGFEDGLIGSREGDKKTLELQFPKDYWKDSFANKKVVFEVNVKGVLKVVTPKLDDELAKKNNLKDLAELKEKVKLSLQQSYDSRSNDILRKDLFDYLDTNLEFTIPNHLVEEEEKIIESNTDNQSKDAQDKNKKGNAELTNKEVAVRRVKLGLFLNDFAKKEKIEITEQDLRNELMQYVQSSPAYAQQIIEHYTKNPKAAEVLRSSVLEKKSVKELLKKVTIQEKKVTPEKLIEIFDNIR